MSEQKNDKARVSTEKKSSSIQPILDIWNVLAEHASPEKPLTISQIADILEKEREQQLNLAGGSFRRANAAYTEEEILAISSNNIALQTLPTSGKTVRRRMPQDIDAINTLAPHTAVCEEGQPTVLHSFTHEDTLHIVIEDRDGTQKYEGDATVVLTPGSTDSIPEKTLNRKLPTLMEQFAEMRDYCGAKPPILSLAGVITKNHSTKSAKYIPALKHAACSNATGRSPTRRYYLQSLLTDAEWRIFSDLVKVFPFIDEKQTAKYLSVLQRIAPSKQKWSGKRYAPKEAAPIQFSHIALLDHAIEAHCKVNLVYGKYQLKADTNGALHPTLQQRSDYKKGTPYVNTVEPYAMMWANGYYYLVGNTEGGMRNFRLDRVMKVLLLDESFEPDPDFDPTLYRDQSPVMYPGQPVYIRIRCPISLINTVTDFFGSTIIDYSTPKVLPDINSKAKHTEISLRASEEGARLFAMQYADQVEVLEPQSLRNTVAESLRAALQKYE